MAHEINMYAIVQKEGLGLDKAIEDCKHRMSRYSVTPNVRVRAHGVSLSPFLSLHPP